MSFKTVLWSLTILLSSFTAVLILLLQDNMLVFALGMAVCIPSVPFLIFCLCMLYYFDRQSAREIQAMQVRYELYGDEQ